MNDKVQEGDFAVLRVRVARANSEQAFVEFQSMEGPYSVRVPMSELLVVRLDFEEPPLPPGLGSAIDAAYADGSIFNDTREY